MINPRHFRNRERSRWLAALSETLGQAQHVLEQLDPFTAGTAEAQHLKSRIAALQSEVEGIRRGRFAAPRLIGHGSPGPVRWRPRD